MRHFTAQQEARAEAAVNKRLGRERLEGLQGNSDDQWDNEYSDALRDLEDAEFDDARDRAKDEKLDRRES